MEKIVASILLKMLPLQALLLVAGLSAAATATAASGSGEDMVGGAIRLPSDDTALGKRPWKCCDLQPCTRSIPAICRCGDLLEKCSDACKKCGKVKGSNPPRYICEDVYRGTPAPRCHEDQGNLQVAAVVRGSKKGGNGEGRPWKCCDKAVPGPTTEGKVVWYCMDKVAKCTCNRCFELQGGSHRSYYCLDGYGGSDPGPSCTTTVHA